MLPAAISGFLLGASLIIAIGAQNAFVLRLGLLRQHVFLVCLICALSDALLITLGVGGFGTLVSSNPILMAVARWGGAAFLAIYGLMAARRAISPEAMSVGEARPVTLAAAVSTCLALTFLNPHVYLDTVVLVGSLSARHEGDARLAFAAGAVLASFVWFFALGYGARLLAPLFRRPTAWRVLDALIAAIMWSIALSLIVSG